MSAKYLAGAMLVTLVLLLTGCGSADSETRRGGINQQAADVTPTRSQLPAVRSTPTELAALGVPTETIVPELTDCTSTLASTYQMVETVEELTWMSDYVVVGTVVKRLAPAWGDAPNPQEPSRQLIYTNSVVQVANLFRGLPTTTIVVQQLGGEIDGCVQTHESEELLDIGDELLLFVRETQLTDAGAAGTYYLTGGDQGLWAIQPDGAISTNVGHLQEYDGLHLSEVTELIQTTLTGTPPESPLAPEYFIPTTEAPVPTVETRP